MPIQVDVPINTGALSGWALWGYAANKVDAVAVNDGDNSLIYAASGGRDLREAMKFPVLSGITDPVTSASCSCVVREYQKGVARIFRALWNSVLIDINRELEVSLARPNYTTVTYSAAGGELALAAVNGDHGWAFQAGGGPANLSEYWITHLYRTVNFTYPVASTAGEFAYMIGSIAAAFIGSNLLLREMPALARLMARRAGYLIRPDEYVDAHRAWREARCH